MDARPSVIPPQGIEAFLSQPCPVCDGKRFVPSDDGIRARYCPRCGWYAVQARYIPRVIRGTDLKYPDSVRALEPYPLTDQKWFGVPWDEWRMRAWRTLAPLAFGTPELFWVLLDAPSLVEIAFEEYHDLRFQRLTDLHTPDLLVLRFPSIYYPNAALASYVARVLSLREYWGRPTWVYSELSLHRFQRTYGGDHTQALRLPGPGVVQTEVVRPVVTPADILSRPPAGTSRPKPNRKPRG